MHFSDTAAISIAAAAGLHTEEGAMELVSWMLILRLEAESQSINTSEIILIYGT